MAASSAPEMFGRFRSGTAAPLLSLFPVTTGQSSPLRSLRRLSLAGRIGSMMARLLSSVCETMSVLRSNLPNRRIGTIRKDE